MPNLMTCHTEATEWAEGIIDRYRASGVFGTFQSGVVWTEDYNPLESQNIEFDPCQLVLEINERGQPLLLDHDPGKQVGRVIAAELFQAADGKKFVGVVLGLYDGTNSLGFSDFSFDFSADPTAPNQLPQLGDSNWIEIATDPREVDGVWVREAAQGAPLQVRVRPLSHNSASATAEIILVTLPYVALLWNPFVTKIASKAGEDFYEAMRIWLSRLFRKVENRRNPIMVLRAYSNGCDVSFIVRGTNLDMLMVARDGLAKAASQAHHLIEVLRKQNAPLNTLFYEFDVERECWRPSYGILGDGRFITDDRALLLAEGLPTGLSLGLGGFEDEG